VTGAPLATAVADQRIIVGPGAVAAVPDLVAEMLGSAGKATAVIAVFGTGSTGALWRTRMLAALRDQGCEVHEHTPGGATRERIDALVEAVRGSDTRVIVAAGGGSVMDAAKAASARLEREGHGGRGIVAIPTTPGTGAEVTPFATVWDGQSGRKHSEDGPGALPVCAVVDPELSVSLPPDVLASSVLDTIVQGTEAAWSTRSTPASIALGLSAVALAATNLEGCLKRPRDIGCRTALSIAGLHGGQAIALAHTGACHALSYPLTLGHGLRHGHACGLPFGAVLTFNAGVTAADCTDPRGPGHVRRVIGRVVDTLGAATPAEAAARVDRLRALGGLASYSAYAIDTPWLAREARTYGRLGNNPRRLSEEALERLLTTLQASMNEETPC
jgi:alcohol dehydrogenase class IV